MDPNDHRYAELSQICNEHCCWITPLTSVTILDDGRIDAPTGKVLFDGDFNFPLKFARVRSFEAKSRSLQNFDGFPSEVGENCIVSDNEFVNLIGSPKRVGGRFSINRNLFLKSLKGFPAYCGSASLVGLTNLPIMEYRYALISTIPGEIVMSVDRDGWIYDIEDVLNAGRTEDGLMPSELIPGKILELKKIESKQYDKS